MYRQSVYGRDYRIWHWGDMSTQLQQKMCEVSHYGLQFCSGLNVKKNNISTKIIFAGGRVWRELCEELLHWVQQDGCQCHCQGLQNSTCQGKFHINPDVWLMNGYMGNCIVVKCGYKFLYTFASINQR